MQKRMFLVDVSSMYFRAFYAIRELTNSKGLPTNALYGFLSMTIKLLREEKPDYMVYCFDSKEPSFRKEIYGEYKAHRTEMPEALVPQVPYTRKLTEALGIPLTQKPGFEADDLIGTLARLGETHGLEVFIVSGDKDFAQLVSSHIRLYDTMKDMKVDRAGVVEKWGVEPEQFIDYLALVGDSSDNIPGVKGIGPKGAQKLLEDYGSLEKIYADIETIKNPSLKKKLIEGRELAFTSQKLSRIVVDVPVEMSLEDCKPKPIAIEKTRELLQELEFKSLETKLLGTGITQPDTSQKLQSVTPIASESVVVQTNTGELKTIPNFAASFAPQKSIQVKETNSSVVDLIGEKAEIWVHLTEREFLIADATSLYSVTTEWEQTAAGLNKKRVKWKGYDLKETWKKLGIQSQDPQLLPEAAWDHLLAAYVMRAGSQPRFHDLVSRYTSQQLADFAQAPDIMRSHRNLEAALQSGLESMQGIDIYRNMDLPVSSVLFEMESTGIQIDVNVLLEQSFALTRDIKVLETEIFESVGESFVISSPKQLGHILFEKLKMPVIKKTKTGYSTDSDVLKELSEQFPICRKVIEFRELSKLKSTYVDALPALVNTKTGRIHTSFNQALTATGRLSSSNPNLQNIPIRTERGNAIRKAFVAAPGHTLISADYSQIELRILAHITGDENMIRAFENDLDIHAATASEVFSVPLDAVTPDLRRVAKEINFGIAYGMSAFGLAENLRISRGEAQDIIGRYFNRFGRIRDYMTEIVEQAKTNGYVTTLLGRRRYIDELKSSNQSVRKFGERAAINAPIQGTASDVVKLAMINIHRSTQLRGRLLLQVHDELLYEVHDNECELMKKLVAQEMSNVVKFKVPLKVQVAAGKNWEEAHA